MLKVPGYIVGNKKLLNILNIVTSIFNGLKNPTIQLTQAIFNEDMYL